jgi:CheY-like chemotaxis protein
MIEKNLRKAIDDARSANSAKSTFLANMSHEIRTPLNAVIGLSRLMKDTRLNPEQTILNDKLLISGENLLNIINEILDFSKIEAGRVELEQIPFNLQTILDRVYGFLSHAAEEKAITLSATLEEPFPKAVVGDPVRLQQILINLVNNAIKFTSEGGIDLSCSLVNESENRATFIFSVTDSGIGISEENLQNIFEKFKQEDESVTRVYGGTGLGLAISRQLVGLMGGELQVTSRKGIGSRFFFTVVFETTEQTLLNEVSRKIYLDPDALKGKNILVVEDNEFNQFIARSILLKWNTNTELAANGREAIEKVGEKNYDMILMDMQMPVMDGLTATRILRKEFNIKTPIIALTAFATTEAIGKAMDAGMNDYLTKPFEEESLFGKLMAAFGIPVTYIPSADTASRDASATKSRQNPQFDLTKLSRLLGDDQSEIIDLIEKFIELTPDYSSALYDAFKQNNIVEIARTSHKIKSSLELLASGNLRSNIKLINEYASSGTNLEKLPSLMKYYQENITKLMQQLAEKVDEMRKALPPS